MHPRTRKGLLTEIGKEAHRIRLDFDASDDTAHSPACPRVPSCPGILEAARFSDRSAWISMHPRTRPRLPACYSCPLLPRNFRGGKNPRPLRLDFDASTDTARLPACPQGPARPASFRAPGMTPLPGRIRLDFDASEDPKGPLYRSGTETLERPSLAKISWAFSLGIVL